jgi:hypothetical protein
MKAILLLAVLFSLNIFSEDKPDENKDYEKQMKAIRDKLTDLSGTQHANASFFDEKRMKEEREWVKQFQAIAEKLDSLEKKRSEKLITFHQALRNMQVTFEGKLKASQSERRRIIESHLEKVAAIEARLADPKIDSEEALGLEIQKNNLKDNHKFDLAENRLELDKFSQSYIKEMRTLTSQHKDELNSMDLDFIDSLVKANQLSKELQTTASQMLNKIKSERALKEGNYPLEAAKILGVTEGKVSKLTDYVRNPEAPKLRTGKGHELLQPDSYSILNFDVEKGGRKVVYRISLNGKPIYANAPENVAIYDAVENVRLGNYTPSISAKWLDNKVAFFFEGKPFTLEYLDNSAGYNKDLDEETVYLFRRRYLATLLDTYDLENLILHENKRVYFKIYKKGENGEEKLLEDVGESKKQLKVEQVRAYFKAVQNGRLDQIEFYKKHLGLNYTKNFELTDKEGTYRAEWYYKDANGIEDTPSKKEVTALEAKYQAQVLKLFSPPVYSKDLVDNLEVPYKPEILKEKEIAPKIAESKTLDKQDCKFFRLKIENGALKVELYAEDIWIPYFTVDRVYESSQVSCFERSIAVIGTKLTRTWDLRFDLIKDKTPSADLIVDDNSLTLKEKNKTAVFVISDRKIVRVLSSPNKNNYERVDYVVADKNTTGEFRVTSGKREATTRKVLEYDFDRSIFISSEGRTIRP